MDRLDALVEQHVREAELRLRHVDTLMDRARDAAAAAAPRIDDALLARVEADRRALIAALEGLQRATPADRATALEHGRGLRAALETVGSELEKALASVVGGGAG